MQFFFLLFVSFPARDCVTFPSLSLCYIQKRRKKYYLLNARTHQRRMSNLSAVLVDNRFCVRFIPNKTTKRYVSLLYAMMLSSSYTLLYRVRNNNTRKITAARSIIRILKNAPRRRPHHQRTFDCPRSLPDRIPRALAPIYTETRRQIGQIKECN